MNIEELDMTQAACKNADPELFFPEPFTDYYGTVERAKKVCATCSIKFDCLQVAIDNQYEGIWGGLTTSERTGVVRRVRTKRRIHEDELPKTGNKEIALARSNSLRAAKSGEAARGKIEAALKLANGNVPEATLKAAQLRLDNPTLSLAELADMAGVTKDSFSGSLRRLVAGYKN
jgi:WhiB family redox-sensing transcriptional regulator